MALVDDLKAARALIDTPEKWGKGEYEEASCLCALGAAAKAVDFDPYTNWVRSPRAHAVDEALSACLPSGYVFVPDFNDAPTTTHADIMALFDRAIKAAEPTNG